MIIATKCTNTHSKNLGSYPANLSAKEFMNGYLKFAEESAKKRAQKYVTNAGNYPYYKGVSSVLLI